VIELPTNLTLRSGPQGRVSKGGHTHSVHKVLICDVLAHVLRVATKSAGVTPR
jgi:hypothetical protein